MDPTALIPHAPASVDNNTVILWVVGVLVVVVLVIGKALWNKMEASEARCREENAKAHARADAAADALQTTYGTVVVDSQKLQGHTNNVIEKVNSTMADLSETVSNLGASIRASGGHEAKR